MYNCQKRPKQKILNYFLKNGEKQNCENILLKTVKCIQKSNKQLHTEIIKIAILSTTPIFRIITLKKKKQKKKKGVKNIKEIPAFFSNNTFRSSWALKLIITITKKAKTKTKFYNNLADEILLTTQSNNNTVNIKDEQQKQAIQKKIFFKRYRW